MKLDYTFEEILNNMLDRANESVDKREGSVIYDSLAPASIELKYVYDAIRYLLLQEFAMTSEREYLILKAKEVGLEVFPAKKAVIKAEFKNSDNEYIEIEINQRFSIEELNYVVTDRIEKGIYKLECEDGGEKSNPVLPADMIPIEYIPNLANAKATDILNRGEDEESTEHLRKRYLQRVREPATSGNIYHYRRWVMEVPNVGGVKVFPLWNGNGTVKLAIVNSKMEVADTALINEVKKHIESIRPIGATVSVVSAKNKDITVIANIKTVQGASLQDIQDSFKSAIKEFFKENAFKVNYVSIAKIGKILLGIENVLDYSELKLNNTLANIEIEYEEIPLLSNIRLEVIQ
ncbi:MAG: baseplate J/gp47 family protein [Peptoanaerobacter stomatis]|uniref:baseplate J/gp47 family protein n=1 Tax=Peptoanaerobacter stomatis TaxID=796937 RepID=UPI003FA00D5B